MSKRHSPKNVKKPKRRTTSIKSDMQPAQFLTIDLDIGSRRSVTPLASAWPHAYRPSGDSRWLIMNAFVADTAENAAKNLLAHIAKLNGKALASWKQAHRRVFDIGVRAGGPGRAFEEVQLSTDTLRRVAAVGGTIQVTIYPAEPKSRDSAR